MAKKERGKMLFFNCKLDLYDEDGLFVDSASCMLSEKITAFSNFILRKKTEKEFTKFLTEKVIAEKTMSYYEYTRRFLK